MHKLDDDALHVMIADDHPVVRRGLVQILEEEKDMTVGAEAGTAEEVLEKVADDTRYDVLILDISMPGANGLELLHRLKETAPGMPILVLSIHPEEQYALRCLRAGAKGYLHKGSAPENLVEAVSTVAGGRRYLSESLTERLLEGSDVDRPRHEVLSNREFQVMRRLALGQSVSEIGEELDISVKTVSTYRRRLLDKMGFESNADITRYALEKDLID